MTRLRTIARSLRGVGRVFWGLAKAVKEGGDPATFPSWVDSGWRWRGKVFFSLLVAQGGLTLCAGAWPMTLSNAETFLFINGGCSLVLTEMIYSVHRLLLASAFQREQQAKKDQARAQAGERAHAEDRASLQMGQAWSFPGLGPVYVTEISATEITVEKVVQRAGQPVRLQYRFLRSQFPPGAHRLDFMDRFAKLAEGKTKDELVRSIESLRALSRMARDEAGKPEGENARRALTARLEKVGMKESDLG